MDNGLEYNSINKIAVKKNLNPVITNRGRVPSIIILYNKLKMCSEYYSIKKF